MGHQKEGIILAIRYSAFWVSDIIVSSVFLLLFLLAFLELQMQYWICPKHNPFFCSKLQFLLPYILVTFDCSFSIGRRDFKLSHSSGSDIYLMVQFLLVYSSLFDNTMISSIIYFLSYSRPITSHLYSNDGKQFLIQMILW